MCPLILVFTSKCSRLDCLSVKVRRLEPVGRWRGKGCTCAAADGEVRGALVQQQMER